MAAIRWLALGMLGAPEINGFEARRLMAGVTWTLLWEWLFYFSLLPLSLFRRFHWWVGGLALGGSLLFVAVRPSAEPTLPALMSFFSVGMLCASREFSGVRVNLPGKLGSVIAVISIISAITCFDKPYSLGVVVLTALAFSLVEQGADLFGALSRPAAIRMGNLSYGIYLLHGLVFFGLFSISYLRSFALLGALNYWSSIMLAAMIVVSVSLVLHVPVEIRGNQLGRDLLERLRTQFPVLRWQRSSVGNAER